MTPNLLTVPDVAARWRRSPKTIRRRLLAGELEGFHEGGEWRIPRRAVEAYEKAHSNVGAVRGRAS